MIIVPIFVHVKEKSDEEIREEMKSEARWRKLMEEEEARERREEERKRREKEKAKMEAEKRANKWWWNLERTNEWETRLLPEGWSIFGQTSFPIIREQAEHDFTEEDV